MLVEKSENGLTLFGTKVTLFLQIKGCTRKRCINNTYISIDVAYNVPLFNSWYLLLILWLKGILPPSHILTYRLQIVWN